METLKAIATRKSVREFSDQSVSDSEIRAILRAGMSGPSCVNSRQWAFVVVKDRGMMNKMADCNGRAAEPLRGAAFCILVCGDMTRALAAAPDYWVIDGAIAAQNMVLAAHDMGIGNVWLGTWPQKEKTEGQAKLLGLPENIIPHSIIAFGYPKTAEMPERDLYEEDRVHFERW